MSISHPAQPLSKEKSTRDHAITLPEIEDHEDGSAALTTSSPHPGTTLDQQLRALRPLERDAQSDSGIYYFQRNGSDGDKWE